MTDKESMPIEMQQWPERLKTSAAVLHETSVLLKSEIDDKHRLSLLTDDVNTIDDAVREVREFNRLLVVALAALIDLIAYENPDQEFPDLNSWFEFKCPNVIFGRHTDNIPVPSSRK